MVKKYLSDHFNLKNEIKHIHYMLIFYFFLMISCQLIEYFQNDSGILWTGIKMIILFVIYNFSYQSLKKLNYTYLTMTFISIIWILTGILNAESVNSDLLSNTYFLAMLLICINTYQILSPIYYPRVRWWEYDFRYRGDLSVVIHHKDQVMQGRLTDLRRKAGCVVLFQDIGVDEIITLKVESLGSEIELSGKIVSAREVYWGRGTTYGIKFFFATDDEKIRFKRLAQFWKISLNVPKKSY